MSVVAALMLSSTGFAQDAGSGDSIDLSAVDNVAVQVVDDPNAAVGDGSEGIAVGEPDPSGDGTVVDDGSGGDGTVVDDGSGGDGTVVDDGSGGDGTDGGTDGGIVYATDDGAGGCGSCIFENTAGVGPLVIPRTQGDNHRTLTLVPSASGDAARQTAVAHGSASCLAKHPGLPWMCEWQNGASE